MAVYQPVAYLEDVRIGNEYVWGELYRTLRPYILGWVYASGVSSWQGQENDIADDILQEAVIRTLKYIKLAESGSVLPVHSMTCFGRTVAHNHFRDLRRREMRLIRPGIQDGMEVMFVVMGDEDVDPGEMALDGLIRISLLMALARLIAGFPMKQRTALLIDLANHTDVSDEQNPLRQAFTATGIDLQEYRRPLPQDPLERSRHAASLSMAYKRLRQVFHTTASDFL